MPLLPLAPTKAGTALPVRSFGVCLWASLADPPGAAIEIVHAGTLLVCLGESTDYYVRVLSPSGRVGWVHRLNVEGAPMPPIWRVIARRLWVMGSRKIAALFVATLFVVMLLIQR